MIIKIEITKQRIANTILALFLLSISGLMFWYGITSGSIITFSLLSFYILMILGIAVMTHKNDL